MFGSLEKPSPVQERAIMPLLSGHDLIMQAQSGTGKTGAFVIGILQQVRCFSCTRTCDTNISHSFPINSQLEMSVKAPQALILAPTHELARQTQNVVLALGQYLDVSCYSCVGGKKITHDIKALARGVQVVVGTPGRLLDLIRREALVLDKIKIFCLDEADEMLTGNFKQQITDGELLFFHATTQRWNVKPSLSLVFSHLEPRKDRIQVVLLSATFPDSFNSITRKVMKKHSPPVKILVKRGQLTLEGIQQFFILMESPEWKLDTLCDLYNNDTFTHPTVVFCNSRKSVDRLVNALEERDLPVTSTVSTLNAWIFYVN